MKAKRVSPVEGGSFTPSCRATIGRVAEPATVVRNCSQIKVLSTMFVKTLYVALRNPAKVSLLEGGVARPSETTKAELEEPVTVPLLSLKDKAA